MRLRLSIALALLTAAALTTRADDSTPTPPPVDTGGPWTEVPLKIEPFTELRFRSPQDGVSCGGSGQRGPWTDVSRGDLPLKGEKGKNIRFEVHPPQLKLDLDGDGTLETVGTGEVYTANVVRDDGSIAPYTFRLRRQHDSYYLQRACMASGEINKVPIHLVDEDSNGNFNDIGSDAIEIGSAPSAQLLSRIIPVKGELYEIQPNQAGTKLKFRKWTGPTGTLDLWKGYVGKGAGDKPSLAMVKSGDLLFDGAVKGGVKIPVGEYELEYALVGPSRDQFCQAEKGDMPTIVVKENETTKVDWGEPGTVDFQVDKAGPVVTLSGIEFRGKAGERFTKFVPVAPTAFATIVEDGTGKLVWQGLVTSGFNKRLATEATWKVRLTCDNSPFLGGFTGDWK